MSVTYHNYDTGLWVFWFCSSLIFWSKVGNLEYASELVIQQLHNGAPNGDEVLQCAKSCSRCKSYLPVARLSCLYIIQLELNNSQFIMVLIWWEYGLYHYSAWLQIPTGAKEPFPHRCCCYNQWNHSGIEGESVFLYCPNCLIWSVIWHYLFQKSKLKASKTQGCKDAYLCEKRRFKLSKRYREDESIVERHWDLHYKYNHV